MINSKILDIVSQLEKELNAFHGARLLCSNMYANGSVFHTSNVKIIPDVLKKEQEYRLQQIINKALTLHEQMYPGKKETPHKNYTHHVNGVKIDEEESN